MENSTLECIDGLPSVAEFFDGFENNREFVLLVPIGLCLVTLALYVINLRATIEHGQKDTKGNVAALLTIYPVSRNDIKLLPRVFP